MELIDIKMVKDFLANAAIATIAITFIYLLVVGTIKTRKEIKRNKLNEKN